MNRDQLWRAEALMRHKLRWISKQIQKWQTVHKKMEKKMREVEEKRLSLEKEQMKVKKPPYSSGGEAAKMRKEKRQKNSALIEEFENLLKEKKSANGD